jgi:hypothetical protein
VNNLDRDYWYEEGIKREFFFVEHIAPKLGLEASINPEKETNPYAPDLVVNGKISDLKAQTTPFFKAGTYGKDAQYTVTFNGKDLTRYKANYPEIHIYFWINWRCWHTQYGITTKPLRGCWGTSLERIERLISLNRCPLHRYKRADVDPTNNAPDSYLIDVRDLTHIGELP